ncbi:MAG: hypothetical protein MR332_03750 [Fusicatenibacter sp.]|nr:hypothetical protein [Fusicatenibacter sp.]
MKAPENATTYEKPRMTFQTVRADSKIANECWKFAKAPKDGQEEETLYYNTSGKGYVTFFVYGADNCSGTGIKYEITGYGAREGEIMSEEDKLHASETFAKWWNDRGSNMGSNFNGDSNYSEVKPDPTWS